MGIRDYDRARRERAKKTLPVRLFGKVYRVPGSVPASVVTDQERLAIALVKAQKEGKVDLEDPNAEVPDELVEILGFDKAQHYSMLLDLRDDKGKVVAANYEEWIELGIDSETLQEIVADVNAYHQGRIEWGEDGPIVPDEDEEGN